MTSERRIKKINELFKREIGKIILREVEFPSGALMTLTRVEVNSDLSEAKVFISALPDNKLSSVLLTLEKKIYFIQKLIDKKVRLRIVPKIIFVAETAGRTAERIEKILDDLKSEGLKKEK